MTRGAWALVLVVGCEATADEACPAWTREDDGRCVLRSWGEAEVVSDAGMREVQVAAGEGGDAIVAWTNADPEHGFVQLVQSVAGGWSPIEFRRESGVGLEPAIAIGPAGAAILAWKQQRDEGEIQIATRDASGAWHDTDAAFSWSETAYEPRVGFAADGEAFVVWNQWTGTNFGVAVALRDGQSEAFVKPEAPADLLSAPVNYANAPRIAIGADGDALVAWYQAPVDDLMVYVSERDAGGSFTHATADGFISAGGAPVDSHVEANAMPALHASGAAAVVWTQQYGEAFDIAVYLATRDADGTWTTPSSREETLSDPGAFARCPQLAFTSDGDLVVTWYESRDGATGVFVWQGDAPERLSPDDAEAVHPALAIDAQDGVMIAWAENTTDAPDTWKVVARRWLPDERRWLDAETISTPQAGLAPTPQLALAADTGAVIAAWAQGGVTDGRVHVASLR